MSVSTRAAILQQTALYRFYDASDQLLYVGITNDTKTRFAHHARQKADTWWPHAIRHSIEWFGDRTGAARAEVAAIENEKPLHNLSGKLAGALVSTSAAVPLSAGDLSACEWINPSEIARRVVSLGIKKSLTRSRVMQLAQSDPAWPVPRDQWRSIANMWLFPWPPVELYFRGFESKQGQRTDLPFNEAILRLEQVIRERFADDRFSTRDVLNSAGCSLQTAHRVMKALEGRGVIRRDGVGPKASEKGMGRAPAVYVLAG